MTDLTQEAVERCLYEQTPSVPLKLTHPDAAIDSLLIAMSVDDNNTSLLIRTMLG